MKKKVSQKQLERLYESFRKKVSEKRNIEIYALKIPFDTLNISLNGSVERMNFLTLVKALYGLDLDDLKQLGFSTGRGNGRFFYLFSPSRVRKIEKAYLKELQKPDLEF